MAGTLAGPAEAEALRGVWSADRSKWRVANAGTATIVQLSLRRVGAKGDWNSSQSVPVAELSGLSEAQLDATSAETRFTWKRDAGTFSLEGRFQAGAGAGHFAFDADPGYVADMERRGYGGIDDEKALSLALHDVSRGFIDELAALGYERVALDKLVALRIHGASAEYVRGLAALGYRRLPVDQLVAFRIHGASLDYLRELQALGYASLPPDKVVAFRIHGVSAQFVRELKQPGLRPPRARPARLHAHPWREPGAGQGPEGPRLFRRARRPAREPADPRGHDRLHPARPGPLGQDGHRRPPGVDAHPRPGTGVTANLYFRQPWYHHNRHPLGWGMV